MSYLKRVFFNNTCASLRNIIMFLKGKAFGAVCFLIFIYIVKKNHPPNTVCLCIRFHHRLGNQLYMFASAYSLAKGKGMNLCIYGSATNLTSVFKIPEIFESRSSQCESFNNTVKETGCSKLTQEILNLPANESVFVSGYLQNYKYFEKHRNDIMRFLSFRDHILHTARTKLKMLLTGRFPVKKESELFHHTFVGVHIRRGDYLKNTTKAAGYRVAPKEYLYKAMNYMRTLYFNVLFIVCSQDVKWSNEIFNEQSDVVVAPIGSVAVDMALLTLMNHTIITVGTYGFWSAWLNPQHGTVIYYKDFVSPNSNYSTQFDRPYNDVYYPYWIGM